MSEATTLSLKRRSRRTQSLRRPRTHADPVAAFASRHLDPDAPVAYILRGYAKILSAPRGKDAAGAVSDFRMNDITRVNSFLFYLNEVLPDGGIYVGCVETLSLRKQRQLEKFPWGIAHLYVLLTFLLKRVAPRISFLKGMYMRITGGKNRLMSRAEAFGRLYFCGFEVIDQQVIGHRLYFAARKTGPPVRARRPSNGLIFKMARQGKDGRRIYVYKMRTMHPYSEFLQEYVYARNELDVGGKLKNDFRVTSWGRVFRKLWIDELPMLINWVKRDLKLVGVRPLSEHFLSLYPPELVERRRNHRPGLVPPFYADLPETLDEIVASEQRYLEAYEQHPIRTDIRYFWRAFRNIVFHHARSG